MTNEEQILTQLDHIRRLIAVIGTRGFKQRDQIGILSQAGLSPKDIAEIVGTSSNTVRVELVALRKAKGRRP